MAEETEVSGENHKKRNPFPGFELMPKDGKPLITSSVTAWSSIPRN
jgi:hypothetical protein